jgi:hypothetical protein
LHMIGICGVFSGADSAAADLRGVPTPQQPPA